MAELLYKEITKQVIGASFEVFRELRPISLMMKHNCSMSFGPQGIKLGCLLTSGGME